MFKKFSNYFQNFFIYLTFIIILSIFCVTAYIIQESTSTTARLSKIITTKDGKVSRALFSPQDNIKDIIINLIEHEQKSINLAIYSFTDPDITKALIDAHNRGIRVEVAVDRGYASDKFSRVSQLANAGIFVTVFQPKISGDSKLNCIMHNKFFVFSKNLKNKQILVTGSFNCTRSANSSNKENVIITEDQEIINSYIQEFINLKKSCMPISGQNIILDSCDSKSDTGGFWGKLLNFDWLF